MSVTLCLASRGDSFELMGENLDNIHPHLKKAAECKTYEAVLEFLKGIKGDEPYNFYHHNKDQYESHRDMNNEIHACSVENMIRFVELRIKEQRTPHAIFDKIGRVLGRTFDYLDRRAEFPILGIIPASVRVIIGLSQMITGLALTIIFSIPAYVFKSENARIIVQRSIKHIGHGPCNMGIGFLQGIPCIANCLLNPNKSKNRIIKKDQQAQIELKNEKVIRPLSYNEGVKRNRVTINKSPIFEKKTS